MGQNIHFLYFHHFNSQTTPLPTQKYFPIFANKKMSRILFLLSFIFLIVSSCADDAMKFNKRDVIEREKFIDILSDIHLMDAITNGTGYFRKYEPSDSLDLYSSIFSKYGVTKAEFDTTVSNYSRRPDLFMKVYDEVILQFTIRVDELEKLDPDIGIEEQERL